MKTINNNKILATGVAIALALTAWLPATARADEDTKPMTPMKGGEHQMMLLHGIKTTDDVAALKTDDSVAMVCAKCQTVWVSRVKQGVKGAQLLMEGSQPRELIGTHACEGCNSTLTITGHAKGNMTELQHSCGKCGDNSAFCCATKPGSGKTKGMKKQDTEDK